MVIPQVWWAAANFAFYLLFQVVTLFIHNYNYYSIDNALTQSVAHSVSIFVTLQVVILLGCWIFQNLEFADVSKLITRLTMQKMYLITSYSRLVSGLVY